MPKNNALFSRRKPSEAAEAEKKKKEEEKKAEEKKEEKKDETKEEAKEEEKKEEKADEVKEEVLHLSSFDILLTFYKYVRANNSINKEKHLSFFDFNIHFLISRTRSFWRDLQQGYD